MSCIAFPAHPLWEMTAACNLDQLTRLFVPLVTEQLPRTFCIVRVSRSDSVAWSSGYATAKRSMTLSWIVVEGL